MDEAAVLKRLQLVDMAKGKFDSIPNYNLEFKPLWSLSETEQADANQKKAATELTKAQTVQIYADLQVLDASEIRSKLAESEEYTINDILDDEEEEDWNDIESNSESEEIREEFGINVAELIPVTVISEMLPEYCTSQVFLCREYYGTPIAFNTEMQDARFEAVTDIMKMDLFPTIYSFSFICFLKL